jgi:hypothetical protein
MAPSASLSAVRKAAFKLSTRRHRTSRSSTFLKPRSLHLRFRLPNLGTVFRISGFVPPISALLFLSPVLFSQSRNRFLHLRLHSLNLGTVFRVSAFVFAISKSFSPSGSCFPDLRHRFRPFTKFPPPLKPYDQRPNQPSEHVSDHQSDSALTRL